MREAWSWTAFFDNLTNTYLIGGVWATLWLSLAAMAIGLLLGLISAQLQLSNSRLLRGIAMTYTTIWRGTPLLVQLIIIYTGLPALGIRLSVIQAALLGLGVNEGAYVSEIVRAGIQSVSPGQSDAARATGMNYVQRMRFIILPQAFRLMVPPLGNSFNGMLKSSSLVSVISMEELLRRSQLLIQVEFRVLEIFLVAAFYYLLLTSGWGLIQRRIERRLDVGNGRTKRSRPVELSGAPTVELENVTIEQDSR